MGVRMTAFRCYECDGIFTCDECDSQVHPEDGRHLVCLECYDDLSYDEEENDLFYN
jgi:uncharacterized Zn ribbon protein